MSEWQDISTAPKNGKPIWAKNDVLCPDNDGVGLVVKPIYVLVCWRDGRDGFAWYESGSYDKYHQGPNPISHWLPLSGNLP